MQVLQRQGQDSLGQHVLPETDPCHDNVPVHLALTTTIQEREALFQSILSQSSNSTISIQANEYRSGPSPQSKDDFRRLLLKELRKGWNDVATETRFFRFVELLQRDGCAVFAGLVDTSSFQQLIDDFSTIMNSSGSHAFLHSFSPLNEHPEFFNSRVYSDAIIHPLLIAVMAYLMGGPVRMTDARGKDTQPISVNAQDNMLHIDNTPFREEYKILLGWEKGKVKGPSGQNFTFLPGTQKGNRYIRLDEQSQPWSTENDTLFITEQSIKRVFAFQNDITGHGPRVIEVEHAHQPVTILFSAGSVVHHRYRNNGGSTRSCVIAAFHLASDHPGALLQPESVQNRQSVADALMGYQDGSTYEQFCSLLGSEATIIETKISEILNQTHNSTLVDTDTLELSDERLERWRRIVINAPSATILKMEAGNYISFAGSSIPRDFLVNKLTGAMAFDKHGLLDLIIYHDGHEEIRKPARKSIWTMAKDSIAEIVQGWIPCIVGHSFSIADVKKPDLLRQYADTAAGLLRSSFPEVGYTRAGSTDKGLKLSSANQLIIDLGESLTRCEKVETYATTNLFLFLIIDRIIPQLECGVKQKTEELCEAFLKAYIACVLVVESGLKDAL